MQEGRWTRKAYKDLKPGELFLFIVIESNWLRRQHQTTLEEATLWLHLGNHKRLMIDTGPGPELQVAGGTPGLVFNHTKPPASVTEVMVWTWTTP